MDGKMTDPDFTLYYFPASYYSQKALCALREKDVPFRERLVYIQFGEHHADWFLRLNPNGKIPVLQDGDKVVAESEEIINYIDKRCPGDHPLVPDIGTKLGQDVDKYRKLLDIDVETISYGTMKQASLRTSNVKMPLFGRFVKKTYFERHMNEKEVLHQEQIDNAPTEERRRGFEERLRALKRRNIVTSDVNQMAKFLDDQEPVFDELEAQLQRIKQSCEGEEYWLCGPSFTAADITATTLMVRLYVLGIDKRYCSSSRPLLCDYKKRLMARSTGKVVIDASDSGVWLTAKAFFGPRLAKLALSMGLVIGALGIVAFIYRRHFH